jgi:hypothetical protein
MCFVMALLVGGPATVHAATLSVLDASSLIQSTATDADALFLSIFKNISPVAVWNYASTSSLTGWTGSLSGSFLGSALSVSYSGDLSAYPSGAVTWTSSGTYAAETWDTEAHVTIVNPSADTFVVLLNDTFHLGANTALLDYTIPGSVLPDGTIMFGSPGNEEVGTGTVSINMRPANDTMCYSYSSFIKTSRTLSDAFQRLPGKTCSETADLIPAEQRNNNNYFSTASPTLLSLTGTITSASPVPEPSPFSPTLVWLTAAGLFEIRRRRRADCK